MSTWFTLVVYGYGSAEIYVSHIPQPCFTDTGAVNYHIILIVQFNNPEKFG